jgi:Fe-S-cluster-containing hydrogenase component 2
VAKAVVNPEAELAARAGDVLLTLEQLGLLGVFASLKKSPTFAKFPGSCILRRYRAGEAICRQGEAGGTAFYLLTSSDVATLAAQLGSAGYGDSPEPKRLATARLLLGTSPQTAAKRRGWFGSAPRGPAAGPTELQPALIANDGPADIDYQTRQAPLFAGEVFGEMSCMTRQPRSATVVADRECFALEFLRNILDQMQRDLQYKQETDRKYRERVLEGHLRQLSIFRLLTDTEYRDFQQRIELVTVDPGTVIWDEGDAADSLLVVRSGIVQVVRSYPWRMTAAAVTDWPKFVESLRQASASESAAKLVWDALPQVVQQAVAADESAPSDPVRRQLVDALNELAKTDTLLSAKSAKDVLADPRFAKQTADFPAKVKTWTGLQVRRANRVLYHMLFPDAVAPPEPIGLTRVLQYLGRGVTLGEMGLVLNQPRSATCVAYSHPEADCESTAVELVRVPADVVRDILARSSRAQAELKKLAASRQERDRSVAQEPVGAISQSRRAEQLGLLQGQQLMLIDLDRCTRCGDCVEACIDTHDDGHSRLYLDGPRFGKYLVPSSCRQCRDPVCMIGCPVGSIQQGDDGEIRIRDWCIGCGVCARQCPYDSIQMHDAAIIPSVAIDWRWTDDRDASVGERWNQPSHRDAAWHAGESPFRWGIDMQQVTRLNGSRKSGGAGGGRLFFRHRFQVSAGRGSTTGKHRLTVATQGDSLEVYLNGRPLELTQDAPQKKRGEFAATVSGRELRHGENLIAARVKPPGEFNAVVLDLRLDELAPESEEVEEKLVTERAVVCDQCSSLPGNRHACVYACPHEAALRVDAWVDFPQA